MTRKGTSSRPPPPSLRADHAARCGGATLGIDLGTSGVRAVVLGGDGHSVSNGVGISRDQRSDPAVLWRCVGDVLRGLDLSQVGAIAVDGTSGTLVGVGCDGAALGPLSLYDAVASREAIAAIRMAAPSDSVVQGATSALGRAIDLARTPGLWRILHEADWIAGLLCDVFDTSDDNNALKTGYDPVDQCWPAWIGDAGLPPALLPQVVRPGTPLGPVVASTARLGLPGGTMVCAGTTDGCASFLSTGAHAVGDAVTALGSTLTVKLLLAAPLSIPAVGIYSHAMRGGWLAGGASNSGGAVLAAYFDPGALRRLSAAINPAIASGLDYYPLLRPGERFPINDRNLTPRLLPRPDDDSVFLQAMLEGIAAIEAQGYRLLAEHSGTPVRQVFSVGGGAANAVWTAIRQRVLGIPVIESVSCSAALGAALLARDGL